MSSRHGWIVALALVAAGQAHAGPAKHVHAATERLGTVHFETSCVRQAQPPFDEAVALMHSFQFGRAIEGFNAVLSVDPGCAVAHWGIALSRWGNPFGAFRSPTQLVQGLDAVQRGRAAAAKTPRERAYLEAVAQLYEDAGRRDQRTRFLAYEAAMGRVASAYPGDTEAAIFHALALAAAADPTDKTHAKQLQAGGVLEGLFAEQPDHPGLAHYIIHAYDEPALAARAAGAARRYGQIAPSTPHALHMPSHTFTRTGDWQPSIDTNLASAAAARAANQPADELHASDYMVYAYLQTAQDRAARRWVDAAADAFSRFDAEAATGAAPASAAYYARAAIPARYCLERRDWAGAARLVPAQGKFPYADAVTHFARGLGAAHTGDRDTARASIASLGRIGDQLAASGDTYWAGQIDIQRREVAAMLAFAEGHVAEALAGMRAAADLEGRTELSSVTPGPLLPAREMLGDLLLGLDRPVEAQVEFETALAQAPNRFWSLYGAAKAAKASGNVEAARAYFGQLLSMAQRADRDARPQLAEARAQAGT